MAGIACMSSNQTPARVTYLLVGGGGAGGANVTGFYGGGGGGGGCLLGNATVSGTLVVTVGRGGVTANTGRSGGNTTISSSQITATAYGGGYGGGYGVSGGLGGSGGSGGGGIPPNGAPGSALYGDQGAVGGYGENPMGFSGGQDGQTVLSGIGGGGGGGASEASGGRGAFAYSNLLATITTAGIAVGTNIAGAYHIAGGGGAGSSGLPGWGGANGIGAANLGDGGLGMNKPGGDGLAIIYYTAPYRRGSGGNVVSTGSGANTTWYHVFKSNSSFSII